MIRESDPRCHAERGAFVRVLRADATRRSGESAGAAERLPHAALVPAGSPGIDNEAIGACCGYGVTYREPLARAGAEADALRGRGQRWAMPSSLRIVLSSRWVPSVPRR